MIRRLSALLKTSALIYTFLKVISRDTGTAACYSNEKADRGTTLTEYEFYTSIKINEREHYHGYIDESVMIDALKKQKLLEAFQDWIMKLGIETRWA